MAFAGLTQYVTEGDRGVPAIFRSAGLTWPALGVISPEHLEEVNLLQAEPPKVTQ